MAILIYVLSGQSGNQKGNYNYYTDSQVSITTDRHKDCSQDCSVQTKLYQII